MFWTENVSIAQLTFTSGLAGSSSLSRVKKVSEQRNSLKKGISTFVASFEIRKELIPAACF